MILQYIGGKFIYDGQIRNDVCLIAKDGIISEITEHFGGTADKVIDLNGHYLSAGWIDLHCHGGEGAEFIGGDTDAIQRICRTHAAHGTRVLYPTLSACDDKTLRQALAALQEVQSETALHIPGAHLEGPYLSPDACGAQAGAVLHPPKESEYRSLIRDFGSIIARWTYAPELDENNDFLHFLTENGIVPSTGHSTAQYDDIRRALADGNRLITHLYSCTSTVVRENGFRKLGIIESAFLSDDIFVEAIADGKHLPKELLYMIYKIKGSDRMCLVTDAIAPAGAAVPTDTDAYIVEDGVAKLPDRSAFAGSIATADMLLKTAVAAGIPLPQAIKMMTATPAKVMGLSGYGTLSPDSAAVFTVFDENLNVL